jgi:signal transduction histidine kinase
LRKTSGGNGSLGKDAADASGSAPTPPAPPVGKGKKARVRNRLIVAVAVVAAAIAGAGVPALLTASGDVTESQGLVDDAKLTQSALALSHSLADERDEVTVFIAAGRPKGKGLSEEHSGRVDRQVAELRTSAEGALGRTLDQIAAVRRAALTGKESALKANSAYSEAIAGLHRLAEQLAEDLPARAGAGGHALADLDHAVEQASAARGLLLAAYAVPRPTTSTTVVDPVTGLPRTVVTDAPGSAADSKERDALSAAAQLAHVRSQAALDDFRDSAPAAAYASYDSTVTGPEVERADKYLAALTDAPTLSAAELGYDSKKVGDALTARVDQMRGAEAALGDQRVKGLEQLRDDDVTALEIRIAVIGVLLLVAVGVAMGAARSLTRPLAVLRLGSARLAGEPDTTEPVKFTGRNDEFAQVVRSVNTLHAHALALHERIGTLESDRKHLIGERQRMADERDALRTELDDLRGELAKSADRLDKARHSIHGTFVNLALRTLGLVERQLGVIEGMEEREQDPERLSTLFKLDHFATVMRRHSENLLVLAGAEHGQQHAGSVPLVDVVRAAVSEIERYDRVQIAALPPHAHIAGFAADDLSHLVAELLENATSFSPPDATVEVSGWLLENGEVMLSVQDEGIGMAEDRMGELNARLFAFTPEQAHDPEDADGLGLGLYVVARLAARHGVRVRLREQKQGGIAAVAVLPTSLLAAAPAASVPPAVPVPGGAPAVHLPGSEAEANSNVLDGRPAPGTTDADADDPLIAAAEQAVRAAESTTRGAGGQSDAAGELGDGAESDVAAESDAGAEHDAAAVPDVRAGSDAPGEPGVGADAYAGAGTDAAPADRSTPQSAAAAERLAETTMELTAPVPPPARAGEPDAHERTPDESVTAPEPAQPATPARPEPDHAPAPTAVVPPQRVTDKGLPKRTPKAAAQAPAPKPRSGSVDAEALRRRLGGFHRGAVEGRRDVAAEIEERIGETKGDSAEEASS